MPIFFEVWLRVYGKLHCNIQHSIKYTVVFFFKRCALLLQSLTCTYCTTLSQQNTPYMLVWADIITCRFTNILLLSQSYRPLTNKYGVDISTWQCMCFIFIYFTVLHCLWAQSSTFQYKMMSAYLSLFRMYLEGVLGDRGTHWTLVAHKQASERVLCLYNQSKC